MKLTVKRMLIGTSLLGVVGVAVLVSGIVPLKASSGHWPITAWFLDYASDRSIDFHSNGIEVPSLDEPGMVTPGAGIYQANCQFCHGQPGRRQPPVARQMTPTPPLLRDSLPEMSAQETFYVVKHGVKFAGMPAWPTQRRDDEIYPLVAFLGVLPALTHQEYLQHVGKRGGPGDELKVRVPERLGVPSTTPEQGAVKRLVAEHCASCHGQTGTSNVSRRVPVLASQNEAYLSASLKSYREMMRYSGVMMPVAYRLTDSQIDDLAKYFSQQSRSSALKHEALDTDLVQLGKQLASVGDKKQKIASCVDCHGPGAALRSGTYPRLAGQPAWYIERQLELFDQRNRGGDKAEIMHKIADKLDDQARRAVAAYYTQISLFEDDPDSNKK